ncbi:hypothetical protein FRC01_002725 [Tulasnella sp. 417]|nr:hypothetical protein FRC01_002725 [Tulasnella sp. 417]
MATSRISLATPQYSEPTESSSAHSLEDVDDRELILTGARAVIKSLGHLFITPERLTFVEYRRFSGGLCDVYVAKLDEASQTPKDVAVERLLMRPEEDHRSVATIRLARQLQAWNGLRHPNVLELLGYYLSPDCKTAELVSPYLINGSLREYLKQNTTAIAQRLGFVRDITAALDYLHNRSPPVYHGDLNPSNVIVNEDLNVVIGCFGQAAACSESEDPSDLATSDPLYGTTRYWSPEFLLEDQPKRTFAKDVWAWGCTAFEESAHFGDF